MNPRLRAWTARAAAAPNRILIGLFVATRLILLAIGCRFDASNLTSWWQIADIALLRDHLGRTLWYLHSQPPVYNIVIGLALKAGGLAAFPILMWLLYAGVTLAGILCFNALARDLTKRPLIALIVSAWFCVSPSVMLFSQKLIYDGLVSGLLCIAFWGLHRGAIRRSIPLFAFGFGAFAIITLLRSMFHPIVFAALVAGYVLLLPGQRRQVLLGAAGPAAAILIVMLKNLCVFGFFGLSSWGPVILSENVVDHIPHERVAALRAQGVLSRYTTIRSFASPADYVPLMPRATPTGEPSLDDLVKSTGGPNYNNIIFLEIGPARMHDALAGLRADPGSYLRTIEEGQYYFHRPSSEFNDLGPDKAIIARWTRIVNATLYLQGAAWHGPMTYQERLAHPLLLISASAILLSLLFVAGIVRFGRRGWICLRSRQWPTPDEVTTAAILLTGAIIVFLASVLNVGENDRAHFAIAPALVLGAMMFLFDPRRARRGAA